MAEQEAESLQGPWGQELGGEWAGIGIGSSEWAIPPPPGREHSGGGRGGSPAQARAQRGAGSHLIFERSVWGMRRWMPCGSRSGLTLQSSGTANTRSATGGSCSLILWEPWPVAV